ncbi:MAG: carboxypeptidase-like regulatory domain-containing protein [Pseudomonadota bacterium]
MATRFSLLRRVAVASLATAASASVLASGPLNTNANDPDGVERWPNGGLNIPWNPDGVPAGGADALALGPLTYTEAVEQTATAFQAWQDIPTATATYSNNGPLPFDVDETNFGPFVDNLFNNNNNSDGLSPIVYDDDGAIFLALFGQSGVLGFASTDTRDADGNPIEGVSFLNGGSILGGFPIDDFFGVQVHEFGHYSGMGHTVVNGQNIALGDTSGPTPANTYGTSPLIQTETMYPFALQGGGESTPHADDIGFYSFMYPTADFFAQSGTISGQILDPSGTIGLTGVNVIARNVADPFVDAVSAISGDRDGNGFYTINGLTPGAAYTIHTDQILQGGFSTTPIALPGPEEFYNTGESNNVDSPDPVDEATPILVTAGVPVTGIDIIMNTPGPGDPLPVGDEGNVQISLPFAFKFCGVEYNSAIINANGTVSFGAAPAALDFLIGSARFVGGPPRIAGLYADLNAAAGGTVSFLQDDNSVSINFDGVPIFPAVGSNTFSIELRANGKFDTTYSDISATTSVAGYTCGGAVATGLESSDDLSSLDQRIDTNFKATRFEQFTSFGNPLDLVGTELKYQSVRGISDPFEPNDTLGSAERVALPYDSRDRYTIIGEGDVDYFSFEAEAGQTLIAEVIAGQIDSVLGLFRLDKVKGDRIFTPIAIDDDGGAGTLSQIQVLLEEDARYVLAVSTFPDFDFVGAGNSTGRYVIAIDAIDGILLNLGDDDSFELDLGFTFPFQGGAYDTVFVNSNGNLTFGAGDTDFSESVAELLAGAPRIAALWDDLSPNAGGRVIASSEADSFSVTFEDVPEFFAATTNTFTVTLSASGDVSIEYGAIAATDGIVGVTEGGGAADPGETDLSAGGLSATGSVYELFEFGDNNDLGESTVDFTN